MCASSVFMRWLAAEIATLLWLVLVFASALSKIADGRPHKKGVSLNCIDLFPYIFFLCPLIKSVFTLYIEFSVIVLLFFQDVQITEKEKKWRITNESYKYWNEINVSELCLLFCHIALLCASVPYYGGMTINFECFQHENIHMQPEHDTAANRNAHNNWVRVSSLGIYFVKFINS